MTRFASFCLCLLVMNFARAETGLPPRRVLKLDLEMALRYALNKNFSIEVSRLDTKIADEGIRRELGRFDPVFNLGATREETNRREILTDGQILLEKGTDRVDRLTSGITGVTAWGTRYDLGYGTRGSSGSNELLDGVYNTTGSLGLTQPLLRDAGPTVNLAPVRIARSRARVSEWNLRKRIIDVMTTTNFVYNDLNLAIEQLRVAERSRGLARQLLKDNQARVEIGVKSPLDVTEARAEVAAREEAVILSQRKVLDNENLLKQLVSGDQIEMLDVRVEIVPPVIRQFHVDVRGGVADALALRPDYRQAILEAEQQHIRVAVQKNALLPRIDLTSSLSLLGIDNDFGGSLGRVTNRDQTGWSVGVIFSIPLGNRQARGAYNQARLEDAKALLAIEALEQQLVVDVDNASGQIVTSRERITSTREARALAQESLEAGEERLRAGTGTTFVVLELQKKLSEAEAAEVLAVSDYNKAVGEYQRQTGTTLREHQVVLE